MKKIGLGILIGVVGVVFIVSVASALPSVPGIEKAKVQSPAIDNVTGNVVAPPPDVTPFPQLSESELTKIIFIRYAPGKEPIATCGNSVCEPKENPKNCPSDCKKGEEEPPTGCYAFLSGAQPKWNWVAGYYYSTSTLESPSASAVLTWEGVSNIRDIFGNGVLEDYPWGVYDGKNSISFGNYEKNPDVIAVTAIWFRGKNIYEYDIMFDTDYFPGGIEGSYDLETVALHEFGHGAGLNDLYDSVCSDNVMYGIYTVEKTTLNDGDIAGIQALYGK